MRPHLFLMCLILIFTIGAQVSSGQQIKVRLINANTGQPFILKTGKLQVRSYDSMPNDKSRLFHKVAPDLEVAERPDGTSIFRLPQRTPPVICLQPDFPFHYTLACGYFCFRTRDVLRRGVVSENKCDPKGKLKMKFIPEPGEFILFVRRYTFWDTL